MRRDSGVLVVVGGRENAARPLSATCLKLEGVRSCTAGAGLDRSDFPAMVGSASSSFFDFSRLAATWQAYKK